jgi:hypothetical protein
VSKIQILRYLKSLTFERIGGGFTDSKLTWRWCFYINLPLGVVAIFFIVTFLHIPPSHNDEGFIALLKEIDIPGTLAFIPAVIALLLALQWGGTKYDWSSGRIIALFVVFGILVIIFIIIQILTGNQATVPPRIFKNRNVWGACLFGFCLGSAFFVIIFYLATWFQAIKGVSAVKSAIMTLPLVLSMTISIGISASIVSSWGYYVPFMIASSIIMTVGAGLMTTLKADSTHSAWMGFQAIFGIGVGAGMQQTPIVIQAVLPEKDLAIGTAIILFAQTFGGALSISVAQTVFANELIKDLRLLLPDLNPNFILNIGATQLRQNVPPNMLEAVLVAYDKALTKAWFVSVGTAALAIFGTFVLDWKNIKNVNPEFSKDVSNINTTAEEEISLA